VWTSRTNELHEKQKEARGYTSGEVDVRPQGWMWRPTQMRQSTWAVSETQRRIEPGFSTKMPVPDMSDRFRAGGGAGGVCGSEKDRNEGADGTDWKGK